MTVFVLGGFQTDFAKNYSKQGGDVTTLLGDAVRGALEHEGGGVSRLRTDGGGSLVPGVEPGTQRLVLDAVEEAGE